MNAHARTSHGSELVLLPCSREELVTEIVDQIVERISDQKKGPVVVDRRGLAAALGVGVDTVDRLRREGVPELTVGDAPRFEVSAVLEFLRARRSR